MKWDVYGAPFDLEYSSCSNIKPVMFSWKDVELDVEIWVDVAIEQGLVTPKRRANKYAWICESRSIVPFFSNLYSINEDGRMFVSGITPILQDMIDEYDAIFTCDKDLVNLHEKIHFCHAGSTHPWIDKEHRDIHFKETMHFSSMIASSKNLCRGHQDRFDLYERIKNEFGPPNDDNINPAVFVFGSIVGQSFGVSQNVNEKWHDKASALQSFVYNIVMENDRYPGYFTEKLTDCFVTGTVPIYYGAPDIGNYFDTDGIIQVNSIDEIMDTLRFLYENKNRMSQYFKRLPAMRKNFHGVGILELPDDMLYRKIYEMETISV